MLKVANEMVASTGDATSGGLELSKLELLFDDDGSNSIAQSAEGFEAGLNERFLPANIVPVKPGVAGFHARINLEAGAEGGLQEFLEAGGHHLQVQMIDGPQREGIRIVLKDLVEGEIAVANGLTEVDGQGG
jgi:hypothetical protein